MIPLHCLWAKSNNRTRGHFECDVTWFCFYFDFVRSHARCDCCSIVCWIDRGVRLKLDVQGQGGGKFLDVDGQGVGGLGNQTIFMVVICVSSLIALRKLNPVRDPVSQLESQIIIIKYSCSFFLVSIPFFFCFHSLFLLFPFPFGM